MSYTDLYGALQAAGEFDHPFAVHSDGTITDAMPGTYAPEVFHSETGDVEIMGDGWEPLAGYTGQHGYSGAVMHASEFLAGRLAEDILANPGTYVTTVVQVLPDGDDENPEPAGWAVLRWVGGRTMTDTDPRFTDRALMGRWFYMLVVWPMLKAAEAQGWLIDRKARHNFGEAE